VRLCHRRLRTGDRRAGPYRPGLVVGGTGRLHGRARRDVGRGNHQRTARNEFPGGDGVVGVRPRVPVHPDRPAVGRACLAPAGTTRLTSPCGWTFPAATRSHPATPVGAVRPYLPYQLTRVRRCVNNAPRIVSVTTARLSSRFRVVLR